MNKKKSNVIEVNCENGGEFGCVASGKHVVGYMNDDPKITKGGIHIPDSVRKSVFPNIMTVVTVGDQIKDKRIKAGCQVFLRGAVPTIPNSKKLENGEPLSWCIEEHIIGTVE